MTIKTKNRILVGGFVFGLIICYQLAFSETFALKNEFDRLKQEQELAENLPQQLARLNQKKKQYNDVLQSYQISETSWQNNLLQRIDRYAKINDLVILKIEEPHSYKQQDLTSKTYQLFLEGEFNNLLGLIYELEQQANTGQLVNVHFNKNTDYRSKKSSLEMQVLIQVVN